jgi:16S rRNA (uracil1498-N3)-methyltransferase
LRAIYLSSFRNEDSFILTGEAHHHLVHVVRVESEEEVLLLDGCGGVCRTKVTYLGKKELRLQKISMDHKKRLFDYDLALGIPKREALELSLKEATELGFRKIYLIRGDFSQQRAPEEERLKKILISALEQSNAAFLPEVHYCGWKDISWEKYQNRLILDSRSTGNSASTQAGASLLVVGPEGGFSPAESDFFETIPLTERLLLPTPILRTPTAVAAGTGVLLQRLMDQV